LEVVVRGSVDVYAARGQYQITVREILPKGMGPLELAFRQLRDRLSAEGLFDPDRKRPIPSMPTRVAVVASPQSAAIRDFLEVALRRWTSAEIVVCPCLVQGDLAVAEIQSALVSAQKLAGCDVIALVRGGGSLEDLMAFNDEAVARAIRASAIPVVVGVGHEIDVTIADLVADVRALTPSEAAERIFPDADASRRHVGQLLDRMVSAVQSQRDRHIRRVDLLEQSRAMQFPREILSEHARRIDDLEATLLRGVLGRLDSGRQGLVQLEGPLTSLNPRSILSRGYALASDVDTGRLIQTLSDVPQGGRLRVQVADGAVLCRVEEVIRGQP
jgi:exodeoxyribonuclease VII large subunit